MREKSRPTADRSTRHQVPPSDAVRSARGRKASRASSSGDTTDASLPQIEGRSVVLSIDPSGLLFGAGVSLADLEDGPAELPPPSGDDRYRVLKPLGRGGMGKVYMVYDADLKRRVALKVIRGRGQSRAARFIEEAQIMAQLEHPNILSVHDLGRTKGQPYYTMPVVRGHSLQQILRGVRDGEAELVKTYSLTRLVQVFLQVAQAIEYAHAKGVIHRDIKPSNIMLGEHGEVRVLDWGLAKTVDPRAAQPGVEHTPPGIVVGTPWYMAPEQALGLPADWRSDVYALGVVLYEILTLRLPFEGESLEVISRHMRDEPVAPRSRAPLRDVPVELETVCLKALRKRPQDRHQSARELFGEIQTWLESEADRSQRHSRADERAAAGRALLELHRALGAEVQALERHTQELARAFRGWQSVAEKAELYAEQDRLARLKTEHALRASEVVAVLTEALGFERDNTAAREHLADFYWERFEEAEAAGDVGNREFYAALVERYHDGKYAPRLEGKGSLRVDSTPPGAEVLLHELVEEGLVLAPRKMRKLGATPVRRRALPMGSYLLTLHMPGYRDVRYPVYIGRNVSWAGSVRLYTEDEIGEGFVYVPGGPFLQGGDAAARGRTGPRVSADVGDFFLARHPVTMGEYLAFLNDLAGSDPDLALRRSPRRGPDGETYLLREPGGRLRMPDVDPEGDRWDPRWPVFLVSWNDAVAYCAWRSRRDGRQFRLPTDLEWEKAARGVDGRFYPWGNRFDPSLCNVRDSRRERPAPVPVDAYSCDESVYGACGMAGNVSEWTGTEIHVGEGDEARDARIVRGGTWDGTAVEARAAGREWNLPTNVVHLLGFRLACSPVEP